MPSQTRKKHILILFISTLICLVLQLMSYFEIFSNSRDGSWSAFAFSLICIVVLISTRHFFPKRPHWLRKWHYLVTIAFSLEVIGEFLSQMKIDEPFGILLHNGSTLFFGLSLFASLLAYKSIEESSGRS